MKRILYIVFVFACFSSYASVKPSKDSLIAITFPKHDDPAMMQEHDVLVDGMLPTSYTLDSIQDYIKQARDVMAQIKSTQNYITSLDNTSLFKLPAGIPKTITGLNYDIGIQKVRFKPAYAELDVFMTFEIPQNGTVLSFMARGIKFTKEGGIVGDARLELIGDYAINFNGDKAQIILKGSQSGGATYVSMDCNGFKEMGLDAQIKFSRDIIVPENADGSIGTGNVLTSFKTILSSWNDLIVQLDLPSFEVTGLNGVGFAVRNAVFDFSDERNGTGVKFPQGYQSTLMLPDNQNLWRGIFLHELDVKLPAEFKSKDNVRTSFQAFDVLIDNMGFTGTVIAKNLITMDKGDMSGWAFSLDSIGIDMQANQLKEAGLKGKLVIPISGSEKPFTYKAIMNTGGNYLFNVAPAANMTFPLWQAGKVDIYKSSYLEVSVVDGKFLPKANLSGKLDIAAQLSNGGQGVQLAEITFENLQLQSVKPYIKVGAFSFGSEALQQGMAGFPISINNIGMTSLSDSDVGLNFDLMLNLVGEENGAFAADAGLTIVGTMDSQAGWQSWKYKDINVRDISVDIDMGSIQIDGSLMFYKNDPAYGDGFNGKVSASFQPSIKLKASAIFGNVKGMRYWYADAMAEFSPGLPIFPAVAIYGFGGGAYFKMKMDNSGNGSQLGMTQSGIIYVPDASSGLGLKATVSIGSTPTNEAFNGDATFEIAFFTGGGIRYISFMGNAFIATPAMTGVLDKLKSTTGKMVDAVNKAAATGTAGASKLLNDTNGAVQVDPVKANLIEQIQGPIGPAAGKKGQISARALINYDFENHVLHGNFTVGINVANGIIQGGGDAVLHFAPAEWYVYVGTPDSRFNLGIALGPIKAETDSYLMVGTTIPGSPPPPAKVASILGGGDYNYMKDLNAIGNGGGFAFGSSFSVSTGDLTVAMFYASFDAGAGFDIMIKNYGDAYCEGSSDRIGINGWYANGQAYAYFDGKIGIRVKVFGKKKSVDILSISAAALLQAQLPNPFWMQGTVGGHFSVLGGLVKGNCKFQITLGNQCKIIQNSESVLDNLKVISQLTPADGDKNVNVFNTPQVVFNMPVDQVFQLPEDSGQKSYRIRLDQFQLTTTEGTAVAGNIEWNATHDVLAFNSFDVLPPLKDIKAHVQVSFEEQINGSWIPSMENGQPITDKSDITFTTGAAPDYIPLENVAYTYPVIGQLNFYKDESSQGYIKLKKGQPYLFDVTSDWKQTGRFTPATGSKSEFGFNYADALVTFTIPNNLSTDEIYAFELINVPAQQAGPVDKNVTQVTNQVDTGNQSLDTEVTGKQAEGSISDLQEKSIFTSYIRSSKYGTFVSKMNAQSQATTMRALRVPWRVHYLTTPFTLDEPFDKAELSGNDFTNGKALIQGEADLANNDYYNNVMYPLVYANYPIDGNITIKSRDVSVMGLPPTKAISIFQVESDFALDQSSPSSPYVDTNKYFQYDLPFYMASDFGDVQQQVVSRYVSSGTTTTQIYNILWSQFPLITKGTYKVNYRYYKPAEASATSQKQIVHDNPIE